MPSADLDKEIGGQVFKVAMRVFHKGQDRSSMRCEGVNLLLADGEVASQEVFQVPLHVVPRSRGDGFRMRFGPHYGSRPDRKELDRVASTIMKGTY